MVRYSLNPKRCSHTQTIVLRHTKQGFGGRDCINVKSEIAPANEHLRISTSV